VLGAGGWFRSDRAATVMAMELASIAMTVF
jgi:hypothetical protein